MVGRGGAVDGREVADIDLRHPFEHSLLLQKRRGHIDQRERAGIAAVRKHIHAHRLLGRAGAQLRLQLREFHLLFQHLQAVLQRGDRGGQRQRHVAHVAERCEVPGHERGGDPEQHDAR